MGLKEWQRRIARAEELAGRYGSAAEILGFYAGVARFQAEFYWEISESRLMEGGEENGNPFTRKLGSEGLTRFGSFVELVEKNAPGRLREAAREVRRANKGAHFEKLAAFWETEEAEAPVGADDFLARAFLQPYAAALREKAKLEYKGPTAYACPFCRRKPGVGVLRPLGEGAQKSLVCSFCLGEWEFRRILCAGCGEGDPAKLPIYAAEELQHVRVDACDSCKCYTKTVDLTKSALGEPVVDEIASVALDLWAQEKGYRKLQVNLMQL